jgi:hypothetical protein
MAETKIKTLKVSQNSTIGGPSAIHTIQGESVTLKYTADPLPPAGQTKVELDNTHVIMTAGLGKEVSIDDSDVNIQHGTAIKITTDSSNGLTVDTTGVKVNVPFVLTNITDQNILVTDSSGNVVSSGKPTPDIYKSEVAEITGHLQSQIDNITGGGGISGLTTNYIPVATSSTALGNSSISQVGSNVRIGRQYIDHDTSNDTTLQGYSDTSGEYVLEAFQTSAGSNKYSLSLNKYGGKVGIGMSPSGTASLQINGTLNATLSGAGSPTIGFFSASDNPYIEYQRWAGVNSDYWGVRLLNKGPDGFIIQSSNPTTIGAQTFTDRISISSAGLVGIGMAPTGSERLQVSGAVEVFPTNAGGRGLVLNKYNNTEGGELAIIGNTKTWVIDEISGMFRLLRYAGNNGGYEDGGLTIDSASVVRFYNKVGILMDPTGSEALQASGRILASGTTNGSSSATGTSIGCDVNSDPTVTWCKSTAATNEKLWQVWTNSTSMYFGCLNDAYNAADYFLTATRSGYTVSKVTLGGGLAMLQATAGDFTGGVWSRDANWGTYYRSPYRGAIADFALADSDGTVVLYVGDARIGIGRQPTVHALEVAGFVYADGADNIRFRAYSSNSAIQADFGCYSTIGSAFVAVNTNHPLDFYTNNSYRMRIANDGPVAIGGSVLQAAAGAWGPHLVVGADGINKLICGYVTSSSNMVTVGSHTTNLGSWAPIQVAGTEVNLSYQETPVLRVGNAKVGINRQATSYALEVNGDMSTGTAIEVNAFGSGNRYALIDFHGDDTYTDYGLRILRDNAGANSNSVLSHRGTAALVLEAVDAGYIVCKTNGSERFKILSDGRVGINTDPATSYQLTVYGDTNLSGAVYCSSRIELNHLWTTSLSSHPTVPSTDGDTITYKKGNYFVIAYRVDTNNIKYRYLDLSSTNATWTYSTSPP